MTLPLAVTIDTREPGRTAWKFSPDVVVTRAVMASGDYAPSGCETVFALERKALGDLVACCTWERSRFVRELERLRSFAFAAIVVEASFEDVARHRYVSRVSPSAVVGSVLAFHLDFGIPTIWAGSPVAAAHIAERLMRRFVASRRGSEAA
jgi:ERCC4-type nuclease